MFKIFEAMRKLWGDLANTLQVIGFDWKKDPIVAAIPAAIAGLSRYMEEASPTQVAIASIEFFALVMFIFLVLRLWRSRGRPSTPQVASPSADRGSGSSTQVISAKENSEIHYTVQQTFNGCQITIVDKEPIPRGRMFTTDSRDKLDASLKLEIPSRVETQTVKTALKLDLSKMELLNSSNVASTSVVLPMMSPNIKPGEATVKFFFPVTNPQFHSAYSGTSCAWINESEAKLMFEGRNQLVDVTFAQTPLPLRVGAESNFIPIYTAVSYVAERLKDTNESQCYPSTLTALRQQAVNGHLLIRGCKQLDVKDGTRFSAVHTDIPKEYWAISIIGSLATSAAYTNDAHTNPETAFSWGPNGVYEKKRYSNLLVDLSEIMKLWP